MTNRKIQQVMRQYEEQRQSFVKTIAEYSLRPSNCRDLVDAGVLIQLFPLFEDSIPFIRRTAILAAGRIAATKKEHAELVANPSLIRQVSICVVHEDRYYRKSAAFFFKSIAKHSEGLSEMLVSSNVLESLSVCLEDFDAHVKEESALAVAEIARHTASLSQFVADCGIVQLLVDCLQEPEINLKVAAASALKNICAHCAELAQHCVENAVITYLSPYVIHLHTRLKRKTLSALTQICKHSSDMAELTVESGIFPRVYLNLRDDDDVVKKNTAFLISEIAKHSAGLSQVIINTGGLGPIIEYLSSTKDHMRLPGIILLGYIAALNEHLAMAVIASQGATVLSMILKEEKEDFILAATVWSLGQLGRYSPEHSKHVIKSDCISEMIKLFSDVDKSTDLRNKCQKSLESILTMCTEPQFLEQLLCIAPTSVLKHITSQCSKILSSSPKVRRTFVLSGGLKKVQELKAKTESPSILEDIEKINSCFPEDVIRYYSPGYPDDLLDMIEKFVPSPKTRNDTSTHKIQPNIEPALLKI